MKILSIPIKVNTLFLNEETISAPASADFQKVPFIDEFGFSKNLETPFISENLISHPFDRNNKLQKGIHLHFEIPVGFKTAQKLNKDTEETYPPLPNRWLVIKNNSKKWIIESDYLWAENSVEEEKKKSITVLLPKKGIQGKTVFSRCRYLGRKYPTTEVPKVKDGENYWRNFYGGQGISAIGYGEPTFSGSYPNCKSVFGFHDENGDANDNYEVIGWYEQQADLTAIIEAFSGNDDLKNHLYFNNKNTFAACKKTIKDLGERWKALKGDEKKAFREKYEKYIFLYENGIVNFGATEFGKAQKLEIDYNQVKAFENAYEVNYANSKNELFLPEQILFVSKIKVLESGKTQGTHTIDTAQIAIGNTGREALNALKAQQQYNNDTDQPKKQTKAQIEAAFELIHCDTIIDKQVDVNLKFQQERKKKTFSDLESGKTWILDIKLNNTDTLSTDNKENSALNNLLKEPAIAILHRALLGKVSDLNALKYLYNKQSHSITSQQHQLFVDWYKYMLTVHPPLHDADNYLASDDVLNFINGYVIKGIYDTVLATDVIENDARQTIDSYSLNQDLDKTIIEKLKKISSPTSTLGKLINLLVDKKDVEKNETDFHLFQSKSFFEKTTTQLAALATGFKDSTSLIDQLNKVKNKTLKLEDITLKNAIIQDLKRQKGTIAFINKWKILYPESATFKNLENFFSNYKTGIADKPALKLKLKLNATLKRLQNAKKQLDKVIPLLENIRNLERAAVNQLLEVITLLTSDTNIRQKANEYLAQSDDNELVATKDFIKKQIKTVFEKEVKAAISVETAIYNQANFDENLNAAITGLKDYLKNYFAIQFLELATSTKIECKALQSKIDVSQPAYNQILAILTALDKEITVANIATLKTKVNTLKTTIDQIKTVDKGFNNQKSILQLLTDFDTIIKKTIDTLEITETDENGKPKIVKKYEILKNKKIDIRLPLKSEPRYYEAKEPVVLIEAKGLTASTQKEPARTFTYEKQTLVDLSYTDFNLQTIDDFKKKNCYKNLNTLTLNAAFWNPIIMDWRVEYLAINDASVQQKYDADFIENAFVLNDDDLELQLKRDKDLENILNQEVPRLYSGSTILSPHAIRTVTRKLNEFKSEEPRGLRSLNDDLSSIDNALQSLLGKTTPLMKGVVTDKSYLNSLLQRSEKIQKLQENKTIALKKEVELKAVSNQIRTQKQSQLNKTINLAFKSLNEAFRGSGFQSGGVQSTTEKTILSQSLGGFNQCLLMRKQTMQLEVDDPIALEEYRPLIKNIRDFVGEENRCAPEPRHYFNPIRSGVMRLKKLRIVDSFGQLADVNFEATKIGQDSKVIVAETLKAKKEDVENKLKPKGYDAFLPARIVQPLRLNLRWISNDDSNEDAGSVHNSPICGWIVPNFLNTTIALFTHKGDLLGDVGLVRDANDRATVRLLPKPGAHSFYDFEIVNTHLQQLVQYLLGIGADLFKKFLKNINNTMVYADPEGYERHTEISMLVGKPLALVRGKVGFQVMEDYAVNQDWAVFEYDVRNANNPTYKRRTYDFEHVELPIKLGHTEELNDGLFGFWLGEEKEFRPVLKSAGFNTKNVFNKTIDEEGTLLTMLFDPRGQLNTFTGTLPTKNITLPSELYEDALKKMKVYFSVGPFITSKSKLQFPIPKSKVYEWKWVYETDAQLTEISTKPTLEKAVFERAWNQVFDANIEDAWQSLLDNNWLQPTDENVTTTYVNFDTKTRLPLPKLEHIETDWASQADQIINQNYKGIAQTTPDVTFGQFELREGWLKMMNEL